MSNLEMSKKEVINDAYHAVLITVGAVAVSMGSKKLTGQSLSAPENVKEIAKLAVAVCVSSYLIKKAQDKKYIPVVISK